MVAIALGLVSGWALGLAVALLIPQLLYRNRVARLEPRFPLLASSIAARLYAGMTVSQALLDVYERDLQDLPEFRVELEYIASGLRAGVETWRVLDEAARITPSPSLRGLLASLAAASKTGAGVDQIVDAMLREYLFNVEGQVDRVVSSLGALLEFFVAASVMLPVAIGVTGLLLLFQPVAGLSFNLILFVTTFIAVPAVAAAVIIIADSTVSRVRI